MAAATWLCSRSDRSGVLLLSVSMFALALLLPAASAQQRQVELLRAADAAQLKAVFFSGEPWLVQCGTKAEISAAIVDDGFGAHAVVEKAASALPKDVKVGLLDCHKQLPSGKTTIERFKLDGSISPLLVLPCPPGGGEVVHGKRGVWRHWQHPPCYKRRSRDRRCVC